MAQERSRIPFSLTGRLALLCLLVPVLAGAAHAADGKRKVIIDDDGFGLMHVMLLEARDVDVLGITTVTGDPWVNRATAYALRGVEVTDRTDVPVVQGATYPLLNSEALTDRWETLYGKLTWRGAWMKEWVEPTKQSTPEYHRADDPVVLKWGSPKTRPAPGIAANFLIQMVHKYPGEITIVACGPMTNLALAQRLDPQFASLAKELIYMGGSFNPQQVIDNQSASEFAREYMNSPRREFNIRFDPEAASIVSRSPWKRIVVVPVDPSTATQLTEDLVDRLADAAGPRLADFIRRQEPGFPLWDQIAAGVFLDPGMVTEEDDLYVDYNTQFGPSYGDTLSWSEHYQPGLGEQKAEVVRAIDPGKLEDLMVKLMANSAKDR